MGLAYTTRKRVVCSVCLGNRRGVGGQLRTGVDGRPSFWICEDCVDLAIGLLEDDFADAFVVEDRFEFVGVSVPGGKYHRLDGADYAACDYRRSLRGQIEERNISKTDSKALCGRCFR